MSRIEAGLLDIRCQPFSLNELLLDIVRNQSSAVQERLTLALGHNLPPVPMDLPRIGTVIRNYVENAIKYSPDNRPIELQTSRHNGSVICTVRDYGTGVPPELQTQIFNRFFRADNRLTRGTGGVGLGLAICKGFVEAHNGRVWVANADPGTTFGFSLPLTTDPPREDAYAN
jgi:signal transduction histidine kinase